MEVEPFYAISPNVSGVSWFATESDRADWMTRNQGAVVEPSRIDPDIREQARAWLKNGRKGG